MTEFGMVDAASSAPAMDKEQFAQLMTTVVAALRQTAAPLSPSQQTVALQFRLLRNGLGRFRSASEAFDRALIRIDQIRYQNWVELVIHDPIPPDARSMVLVIDSDRIRLTLPGYMGDGKYVHRFGGDSSTGLVELVEFLDQFEVAIAAGVPRQLQDSFQEEVPEQEISQTNAGAARRKRS